MRIRIFHAFASNNSGSYSIVGSFQSVEKAEEVARILQAVCAEHDAWNEKNPTERPEASPLDAFVHEHGLHEELPGRDDEWPQHGAAPTVLASALQVLVHAPYTLTLPRLFGELFYQHGGRVDVELNHAHEPLATTFHLYVPNARANAEDAGAKIDALVRDLDAKLPEALARGDYSERPPVAPVWSPHPWAGHTLTAVFPDVVAGVELVRESAAAHGVAVHLSLRECEPDVADPLAALRAAPRPWGRSRVILWSVGDDRVRALKAVREALHADLDEATQSLEGLPKEVLIDVDAGFAQAAVKTLQNAGCDAEVVVPATKP